MRQPLKAGSPVNSRRYKNWIARFGAYRAGITQATIDNWLDQFKDSDKDLAARVLDAVIFFNQDQIAKNFRSLTDSLDGWHKEKKHRSGRWFFVAMSGSAGESGDSMLYIFRMANGLDKKHYNDLFISRSDLVRQKLGPEDTVVLLDDFSGTGKQVCDAWTESFGELVAGAGQVYLILVAATKDACDKIANDTDLSILPAHKLSARDNFFSNDCSYFSKSEKETILTYNKKADGKKPKGFGDCGLLVVFHHKCPNNSLPILHRENRKWSGLFPSQET